MLLLLLPPAVAFALLLLPRLFCLLPLEAAVNGGSAAFESCCC
jgi:hypothetical protein